MLSRSQFLLETCLEHVFANIYLRWRRPTIENWQFIQFRVDNKFEFRVLEGISVSVFGLFDSVKQYGCYVSLIFWNTCPRCPVVSLLHWAVDGRFQGRLEPIWETNFFKPGLEFISLLRRKLMWLSGTIKKRLLV